MPLRGPRFSRDPVLEECFAGRHRMMAPEDGLPVMRVQHALLELGWDVGPAGADGRFGADTGGAVSAYKSARGLSPADPVVGPGTSRALDDDLFVDPPQLDPAFGPFATAVVDHRLEPFVARALLEWAAAPFDSWRHTDARAALDRLGSGALLGIVAWGRAIDLRDPFLRAADPVQPPEGDAADWFFDQMIIPEAALGLTVGFRARDGGDRAFSLIADGVVLGRGRVFRRDGASVRASLDTVLIHELAHARNVAGSIQLLAASDDDAEVFADPALARARSATGTPSAVEADQFVGEIVSAHIEWVMKNEAAGTPGGMAVSFLPPERLAAAIHYYFIEVPSLYRSNGYADGIDAQGDSVRYRQVELWTRLCAGRFFSDDPAKDEASTTVFLAAADVLAGWAATGTLEFPAEDGLTPLIGDFSFR